MKQYMESNIGKWVRNYSFDDGGRGRSVSHAQIVAVDETGVVWKSEEGKIHGTTWTSLRDVVFQFDHNGEFAA